MIDTIHIVALKSIRDLKVKCSKLNLFVGTNSSGKSTFLQALLLLKQQELNGKYISIGEFREVRNYYTPSSSIKIEILDKKKEKPAWIEFIEDKEKESYTKLTSLDETSVIDVALFAEDIDTHQTDY